MRISSNIYPVAIYISSWILIYCLSLLTPAKSTSQHFISATLLITLYVTVSSLVAIFLSSTLCSYPHILNYRSGAYERKTQFDSFRKRQLQIILWLSSALAILGILLITYDRTYVQGIDYSKGIAFAREQWRISGESRQGISSIASLLGNVLAPFCFIPLAVTHLHWERLSNTSKYANWLFGWMALFGICLLSGGRSPLLTQVSIVVSVSVIRKVRYGVNFFPGSPKIRLLLPAMLFTVILAYSTYVFSVRANASNMGSQEYAMSFIHHLGGRETDSFYGLDRWREPFRSAAYFFIITLAYVVHSLWNLEVLIDSKLLPTSHISFIYIRSLLSKLGIMTPPAEPVLAQIQGRFLPLPGILWYDFGELFLMASIVHGFLLGLSSAMLLQRKLSGASFVFCLSIFCITFLSPFCFAADLYAFPFIVFSCIVMDYSVSALVGKKVYWL